MSGLARIALRSAPRALQRTPIASGSCFRCTAARSVPIWIGGLRGIVSTSQPAAEVRPGAPLSQTNRAEATLRRFWKTVNIKEEDGGLLVTLDHRNLRTPGGKKLVIPREKRLAAALIANEWENQDEVLKQHALPVTSLASRALDGMTDDHIRQGVADHLLRYIETDTICFPEEKPDSLVRLQKEHWDPLFVWVKETLRVDLNVATGFSPARQSKETVLAFRKAIESLDHWEMASLERAVYASKSLVIGLALVKNRLTANEAAEAAQIEVRSQIEKWGEVEDSHDVDYQDIRRALGSVACLLIRT